MYLSAREKHIIDYLLSVEDGLTIKEIANKLNVSSRTIHRDIQGVEPILHQFELKLEKQTGVGLKLIGSMEKRNELREMVSEIKRDEYTPEERQQLLLSILLQKREPVKLFTLAKEIGVTIATISNDLNKVSDWLEVFRLEMVRKRSYGIEIQGDESNKRRALRRLITEKVSEEELLSLLEVHREKSKFTDQTSEKLLHLIDVKIILDVLATLHELRERGEPIADVSFVALAVHLSLAVDRINRGERIEDHLNKVEKITHTKEYQVAKKLVLHLEEKFSIEIPPIEIVYVTMHLLGAKQGDEGGLFLQETSLDLAIRTKQLIDEVGEATGVALRGDQSLLEGLVSHLKPALFRIEQGMTIYNALLPKIKVDYKELFLLLQKKVPEVFPKWEFPDEEIGYLVMHFGSSIEGVKHKRGLKAIVVCSSGIGTSKLLATRLEKEIPEIRELTHMSAFDMSQDKVSEQTIVISTVPLSSIDPYFLVNPFLSKNEVDRIRHYIHTKDWVKTDNSERKADMVSQHDEVKEWLKEDALTNLESIQQISNLINSILTQFELKTWSHLTNPNALIHQLAQYQEDKRLVENRDRVADALIEREQLGGLAIPGTRLALFHTRSDDVKVATFTVHELPEPMQMRGMDNEEYEVSRILLMLAPERWNKQGLEIMSFISASIIESDESIQRFETGDEQAIFTLLERNLKEYLITKLQK